MRTPEEIERIVRENLTTMVRVVSIVATDCVARQNDLGSIGRNLEELDQAARDAQMLATNLGKIIDKV